MINPPNAGTIMTNSQYVNGKLFSFTYSWISVSDDLGESWVELENNIGSNISNIVWTGTLYGLKIDNRFYYSIDGINWNLFEFNYNLINLSNSTLVVSGEHFIISDPFGNTYISTNGSVWQPIGLKSNNREYTPIPSTNDGFACIITDPVLYKKGIVTIPDPEGTWSSINLLPNSSTYMQTANGSHVVRIGNGIQHSENGVTWTAKTFPNSTYGLYDIAFGDNKWVAGCYFGLVKIADSNFNLISSPTAFFSTHYNNRVSVVYDGTRWIALSTQYEIATSTDAITWTVQPNPGNIVKGSLISGNGITFATDINSGNIFQRTINGVDWVSITIPNTDSEHSPKLSFAGSLFILSYYTTDKLWVSTDGIEWTEKTSLIPYLKVSYADGIWLLPGGTFTQDFITYHAKQRIVSSNNSIAASTETKTVYFGPGNTGSQVSNLTVPFEWVKSGNANLPYSVSNDPIRSITVSGEKVLAVAYDQNTYEPIFYTTIDGHIWEGPVYLNTSIESNEIWLHSYEDNFYVIIMKDNSGGYQQDINAYVFISSDGINWTLSNNMNSLSNARMLFAAGPCFYLNIESGFISTCDIIKRLIIEDSFGTIIHTQDLSGYSDGTHYLTYDIDASNWAGKLKIYTVGMQPKMLKILDIICSDTPPDPYADDPYADDPYSPTWISVMGPAYWNTSDVSYINDSYTGFDQVGDGIFPTAELLALNPTQIRITYSVSGGISSPTNGWLWFPQRDIGTWIDTLVLDTNPIEYLVMNAADTGLVNATITNIEIYNGA